MNARAQDPIASQEAASLLAGLRETHHQMILAAMEGGRPMGAEQIGDVTGLQAYQIRKRLPELAEQRLVVPTNQTRLTSCRRNERLWRLA